MDLKFLVPQVGLGDHGHQEDLYMRREENLKRNTVQVTKYHSNHIMYIMYIIYIYITMSSKLKVDQ